MSRRVVLVLGGTRSGKSRFALTRAADLAAGRAVTFVATAWRGDPELEARIAWHVAARPTDWPTIEAGPDLAAAVQAAPPDGVVLIDGLTLWLSGLVGDRALDPDAILTGPLADLRAVVASRSGSTVLVSDEIGLGIVPLDPGTRAFRDVLGLSHQALAELADEVVFLVAGLPIVLKSA